MSSSPSSSMILSSGRLRQRQQEQQWTMMTKQFFKMFLSSYLIFMLSITTQHFPVDAFTTSNNNNILLRPQQCHQQKQKQQQTLLPPTTTTSLRSGIIEPPPLAGEEEEEKEKKKKNAKKKKKHSDKDDWTPTNDGGFIPNISRFVKKFASKERKKSSSISNTTTEISKTTTSSPLPTTTTTTRNIGTKIPTKKKIIEEVTTIHEYKDIVVDEKNCIVVVRFYAPWCRSCKAAEPLYKRLASQYHDTTTMAATSYGNDNDNDENITNRPHAVQVQKKVKFVDVPVRKDNAFLVDGLGVPSFPFGHIYHPDVGLVEERKINKKDFRTFQNILDTYVKGYCDYVDDVNPTTTTTTTSSIIMGDDGDEEEVIGFE